MKRQSLKRTVLHFVAAGVLGLPLMAAAVPIQVTYDIGPYAANGYSASWLHSATGCSGSNGPDTLATLYMCGGSLYGVTGTIAGLLNGGVLAVNGGSLNIANNNFDVLGGSLGGSLWTLSIQYLGLFQFESINLGAGLPNSFDGTELILWGQNQAAYNCAPYTWCKDGKRWGIDLYGTVRVPEPGMLALFGIGLIGLALVRRRKV